MTFRMANTCFRKKKKENKEKKSQIMVKPC